MISEHIIKNLKDELDRRDFKIKNLEKKNHELECVQSDWIEKDLVTPKKKFPDDYIKQKKEFAERIVELHHERERVSEILDLQQKRHKEEISLLKFKIEMLEEQVLKKPNMFAKIFNLNGEKS